MKSKTEIASELLNVIQSLGLSPVEVKHLTLEWIKAYPFVLEDFGWDVQIHVHVKNISAEVKKLQDLLREAKELEAAFAPFITEEKTETSAPISSPVKTESVPAVETLPVASPKPQSDSPVPSPKPQSELPAAPITLPKKGYSKNGKKLGRPPGKKAKEKPVKTKSTTKSKPSVSGGIKTPPSAVSKPADKPLHTLSKKELIERLKFGKPYSYDLLYLVNNSYVRSPFKLRDEAGVSPVGVVIPYTYQDEPYEIVVHYTDETAAIPLNTAQKYAKNKLLPYKGVNWRVKEATDDAHIRPALSEINEIFKKIGGDIFKGNYVDGRSNHYDAKADLNHKIRYVCDIPLSQNEQSQ